MELRKLDTKGAQLAVRDSEGEGTPIVFISGGPGMPDYLQDVAKILEGRRVVTYDQRGTGASLTHDGDLSVGAHVSDLEGIHQALGGKGLHLFGHSWGGLLATLYATEHIESVSSLFLCSPLTGVGRDWLTMEKASFRYHKRRRGGRGLAVMALWALLGRLPGHIGERSIRRAYARAWENFQSSDRAQPPDRALIEGVGRRAAVEARTSAIGLPSDHLDRVLPYATLPMRVIFGEQDIFGDESLKWARRYPKAQCEFWQDCGHLPWIDDRPRFTHALREFYGQQA